MVNTLRSVNSVLDLIGNTPVIRLKKTVPEMAATVWAKLENLNPAGSVKERICLKMIEVAEREGKIRPGKSVIVEPTSGNTGIGLALLCAVKGYRLILTMPDDMSLERRLLLAAYGAELVLTPAEEKMEGAVRAAENIVKEDPNAFMPQQFKNQANPEAHRLTTGPEILEQVPGEIHAFVSGVGTGGTITGVGEILRKHFPQIHIVAVEPAESAVLSGKEPHVHDIQGIGAGFVPDILNTKIYDEIMTISGREARAFTKLLAKEEGLLVGISAGAAGLAAVRIAERLGPSKQVVTIFCDTGERYLSTEVFKEIQ
ncbi:MAG TPA: cysteine synthase A [Thermodesulfobacteriota bacterium]|nr:cysteine synthase A [Thermodesulfobacteriota bacterium]